MPKHNTLDIFRKCDHYGAARRCYLLKKIRTRLRQNARLARDRGLHTSRGKLVGPSEGSPQPSPVEVKAEPQDIVLYDLQRADEACPSFNVPSELLALSPSRPQHSSEVKDEPQGLSTCGFQSTKAGCLPFNAPTGPFVPVQSPAQHAVKDEPQNFSTCGLQSTEASCSSFNAPPELLVPAQSSAQHAVKDEPQVFLTCGPQSIIAGPSSFNAPAELRAPVPSRPQERIEASSLLQFDLLPESSLLPGGEFEWINDPFPGDQYPQCGTSSTSQVPSAGAVSEEGPTSALAVETVPVATGSRVIPSEPQALLVSTVTDDHATNQPSNTLPADSPPAYTSPIAGTHVVRAVPEENAAQEVLPEYQEAMPDVPPVVMEYFEPINKSIEDVRDMLVIACQHLSGIEDPAMALRAFFEDGPNGLGLVNAVAPSLCPQINALMRYISMMFYLPTM